MSLQSSAAIKFLVLTVPPEEEEAVVVAAAPTAGVRITTGLTRRTLEDWRQEIVAFWRNYFGDAGLPEQEMIVPHTINLDEDEEDLINLL